MAWLAAALPPVLAPGLYAISLVVSIGMAVDMASRSNDRTQTPENRDDLKTKACFMSSSISGSALSKPDIAVMLSKRTLTASSPSLPTVT
jgi:hypothetical protein